MADNAVIEVRRVESLAEVGEPLEQVATVLYFLLTSLLKQKEGLLHAEHRRPQSEVTWYVRPRADGNEGHDGPVAILPAAILQSCTARMAMALDLSHIEGGYRKAVFSLEGRRHECSVYVSNCRQSGCWMRIYARAI